MSNLTVASCPAYKFLRKQIRWSAISISKTFPWFVVIYTSKGCSIVNEAEVDFFFFLEFLCFFYDPTNVGKLISDSYAFYKSRLYFRKVLVHVLLKSSLKDFEHYFASKWNECNCMVVWTFFGVALLWDWNEEWPFPVLWPLLSFPNLWHTEHSTLTASSFRIWNSPVEIPSPPLSSFVVMLPKAHLTSHSRISGCREVIIPSWLSGSLRPFLHSSSVCISLRGWASHGFAHPACISFEGGFLQSTSTRS